MSGRPLVALEDLAPGEDRARAAAALGRYRLVAAGGAEDPLLDRGYRFLEAYFGPKNEIERREVVDRWASGLADPGPGFAARYRMILAFDPTGALAGVRDAYAVLDPAARVCVVYMAHLLLAPDARRGGLASLLRAAAATLGRELIAERGLAGEAELLLAVEQEPIDPADADSHVRLVAYGRAGFQAVDPRALPYCQPDFRDLDAAGVPASPLPLLAVVRRVGHESERALPTPLARAFVTHLYAVFATHCRPADLVAPREHALAALARHAPERAPLLPLPRSVDEAPRSEALLRPRVLGYYSALLEPPCP